jgi:hypothetical protein
MNCLRDLEELERKGKEKDYIHLREQVRVTFPDRGKGLTMKPRNFFEEEEELLHPSVVQRTL